MIPASLQPEISIDGTREQWEEYVSNIPSSFKFDIVSEDKETGTITLDFRGNQFDFTCKNKLVDWNRSRTYYCDFVFDGERVNSYFTEFLWHFHKDEIVQLVKNSPGVKRGVGDDYLEVSSDDSMRYFFYELMKIDDYKDYYTYLYNNNNLPKETCTKNGSCSITADRYNYGKIYVNIDRGDMTYGMTLLEWAAENNIAPSY